MVSCLNVDAVIAALFLGVLGGWNLGEKDLQTAAFNPFAYGCMIEVEAEIDDRLNRGRNMDIRAPRERCMFVV